jgi:gamma-glutamyl-gamma-aminobutyrate hydrolase PuuD
VPDAAVKDPPLIGLTTYREPAAWGVWSQPADLLPADYSDGVRAAGGVPLLLPPVHTESEVADAAAAVVRRLDGLVLAGGADIDPERYGAPRRPATGPPRPERDSWETALATAAVAADLPLLGVCRGMQVMAVAFGGSLEQHLPDRIGSERHRPVVGQHGRHDVRLLPGSRLNVVLGERWAVATYHHQAVDRLPPNATATGWADDGVVEAFELQGAEWAVAVQWHPEAHAGQPLFSAFVDVCDRRRLRAGHGVPARPGLRQTPAMRP